MGWMASLVAVQKKGDTLVPIAPLSYKYEDTRWQIWGSYNRHMKNFMSSSALFPLIGSCPYFENRGRFYGKLLPFLGQDIAAQLKAILPPDVRDYLDDNIGPGQGFFLPALFKDWLDFDYDQLLGSFDLDATGTEEEITFRQFIERYDHNHLFEAMDYLKQQGNPEDIYLLAWWA